MALVLPMILVAYDYIFRREKKPVLDYLKGYIPYVMVASVYLVLRFHILGGFVPVKSYTDLSAYQYVINVFPLFMKYLEKLLFPVNLNFWHSFHPIKSIIEPEGILSLTITAVFCVLSLISIKRNRVVFFGLLFVAVALLPVFYIPGIPGKPFAERYLYLPSFGFVILVAIFFAWIKAKIPGGTIISTMVSIALMGAYFVSTVSRNAAWNDNYILWSDTVRKSPDGALPRNNLGNALMKVGRIDEAIEQYNIALRLEPDSSEAHNNLGGAYYMKDDIDKALGHFKIAIALNPDNVEAHNNLGSTYLVKGLLGEALAQYHIALRLKPDYAEAHYNMGLLHRRMGSEFGAKDEFGKALRVNPNLATSR
ncbi:MAG TPA: tetratricopeptide repeat protein [Thermodesulfovibrionales bacterium]|nr:tetratricopeptide repeat protein [Thermodesulfovibrionales bacterium]